MNDNEYIVVFNTCPNAMVAENIGRLLVENGLAACVNIVSGLTSIYKWKGEIVKDSEVLLIIKTIRRSYPELEKIIKRNHPYEVPEIIALPIVEGSEEYLNWLKACGK